jgi:hypothetical protein
VGLRPERYYATALRAAVTPHEQGLHKSVKQTPDIPMPPQPVVFAARTTLRTLPGISLAFFENLLEIQLLKEYHLKYLFLGA